MGSPRRVEWTLLSLGLVIGIPTLAIPDARAKEQGDDFGWWNSRLSSCSVVRISPSDRERRSVECLGLRLDQQIRGLISLSFAFQQAEGRLSTGKVVFAGVLEGDSQPMRCGQGRCEPRFPIWVQVSAVAQSGFEDQGVATALPRSYLVRGHCSVQAPRIRCQATSMDGTEWHSDALL